VSNVVYYLRRNGLIKIGWSGNLAARMRTLRPGELLAVEPGCLHIETGRHHQFAEHRLSNDGNGDEWFSPDPELLAHIELIAQMYPTPDLAEVLSAPRGTTHSQDGRRRAVPLRLSTEEERPVQAVADAEHGGNLSAAIRALIAEALAARVSTVNL
jgi:hypothetical protein